MRNEYEIQYEIIRLEEEISKLSIDKDEPEIRAKFIRIWALKWVLKTEEK